MKLKKSNQYESIKQKLKIRNYNRLSYNRKKWISKISLSKVIYEQ